MISLKASRFLVSCENYESKVFIINNERKYKEVTNELSEDDKTDFSGGYFEKQRIAQ